MAASTMVEKKAVSPVVADRTVAIVVRRQNTISTPMRRL